MADKIDFSQISKDRGYDSAFDTDIDEKEKRLSFENLKKQGKIKEKVGHKRELEDELIREEGKAYRAKAVALDAFSRHKEYINNYLLYYGGSRKDLVRDTSKDKTDIDIIRENHKFLWNEEDDDSTWEKRLAKKYYDKLFKEYCIADLSRYKENKVGMRWRIEKEVVDGKGQFMCGNKRCNESEGLRSWEVNFGYIEHGEKKNALIKLRLCPDCSYKLNYHHKRKEVIPKLKVKEEHEPESSRSKKKKKGHSDKKRQKLSKQEASSSKEDKDYKEQQSTEDNIWLGPAKITEEKTREEEIDQFLQDMFF